MPVAYGRLAVRTTSAAVRGCFPNILWLVMILPKMQQAYNGVRFRRGTSAFEDQLDGTPAMTSQIGDGGATRTAIACGTAVADF